MASDDPISAAAILAARPRPSVLAVFWAFLRLGLTSFGGPVAHLGYFRAEFVARRRWIAEGAYADIVALCQFLPGPASSQVGMAIGLSQAGLPGLLAAWCGFTLPSAAALTAFAYGVDALGGLGSGWLHGLKVAAVAIVAQAVWGMARTLAPDPPRATVAAGAALLALGVPDAWGQLAAIAAGGLIGWRLLKGDAGGSGAALTFGVGRGAALTCLGVFFALLAGLPVLRSVTGSAAVALVDSFYRSGALVFGGGHVVLPLLQSEFVAPGWITSDRFLAGYGAAQAVPGPLFTFSAYLGAALTPEPHGVAGALLGLVAIFLPSLLLLLGVLPFWEALRGRQGLRSALGGINAAVVGLLLAALYHPMWTSAILSPADFGLALGALLLLQAWKVPPWLVVMLCAGGGALLG
jgi:chromate transporter